MKYIDSMLKDKILVVGGYGQVGRYVTLELITTFPKKIIVAGRNLEKANSFAREYNNLFETQKIDIYDLENITEATKNVKVVVMLFITEKQRLREILY